MHVEVSDMQALTLHTFPTRVAAGFLALVGALAIGGSVGYTLKPSTVISAPAHTIIMPVTARQVDTCVIVLGHRGC
jgi:hypothetical protein